MTPEDLVLVQSTFADVLPRSATLAASFYDRLFTASPELRPLFPDEMSLQRQKLIEELAAIVDAVSDLPGLIARTAPLGQRHRAYGAKPLHYRLVGECLLASLADQLGEDWTPEVARAWTLAYRLVAETMQQGAYATG